METKMEYFVIYYNIGYGWKILDDIEYTRDEVEEELKRLRNGHSDIHDILKFRKKSIGTREVQVLSVHTHK